MACGFNYKSMTPILSVWRCVWQLKSRRLSFARHDVTSVSVMKINEYFCYIWLRFYRDLTGLVRIWLFPLKKLICKHITRITILNATGLVQDLYKIFLCYFV